MLGQDVHVNTCWHPKEPPIASTLRAPPKAIAEDAGVAEPEAEQGRAKRVKADARLTISPARANIADELLADSESSGDEILGSSSRQRSSSDAGDGDAYV